MISLKKAIDFHGHLGPYLVLGILAGESALKKIKCKKYFGLEIKIWGANKKPKSCFIDGLQLSTGATYGKGNIKKLNGSLIKIEFKNYFTGKKLILKFKNKLIKQLEKIKTHKDSEILATKLYRSTPNRLFNFNY